MVTVSDRRTSGIGRNDLGAARPSAGAHVRLFSKPEWHQLTSALELPPRQSEVARLVCDGCAYKTIASQMGVSINTVRMHMRSLFLRLGAHDRLTLVLELVATQRTLARRIDEAPPILASS